MSQGFPQKDAPGAGHVHHPAGWILAGASALLLAVPAWVWLNREPDSMVLLWFSAFVVVVGVAIHSLVLIGVCVAVAITRRRILAPIVAGVLALGVCVGIALAADRNVPFAAGLEAAWAVATGLAGLWLARD